MSQQPKLSFLDRRAIVPSRACIDDAPTATLAAGSPSPLVISAPPPFSVGTATALGAGFHIANSVDGAAARRSGASIGRSARARRDPNTPDLGNVQGDVYFMFPKKWERFLFFKITDTDQFRKDLAEYCPEITSSRKTAQNIYDIHNRGGGHADIVSTGIAFARAGLNELGHTQRLRDPHFDNGSQSCEKDALGDRGDYVPLFDGNARSHGVILLTARERNTCETEMNRIRDIFDASITVEANWEGRVRVGHGEHFGWRDGISQPAIDCGWVEPKPGQRVVKPGVIIMGYPGDPVHDDGSQMARPDFTKDGTFMVFRKLEQNVLFLEDYIEKNWRSIPVRTPDDRNLTPDKRKLLFGARLVGRYKSGVPLALSPYIEDPDLRGPEAINDFDYTETGGGCPFAAHIRKTEPRNLLPVMSKEFLDASVIVRAGIPYGDDISQEDRNTWATLSEEDKETHPCPRGLLFVCYQSSIHNGFYRQTVGFANNDYFPVTGPVLNKIGPYDFSFPFTGPVPNKIGQDPIIGGPQPVTQSTGQTNISEEGLVTLQLTNAEGVRFKVSGVAEKADTSATAVEQKFFVTSRGGEYYFVPSISTVWSWADHD